MPPAPGVSRGRSGGTGPTSAAIPNNLSSASSSSSSSSSPTPPNTPHPPNPNPSSSSSSSSSSRQKPQLQPSQLNHSLIPPPPPPVPVPQFPANAARTLKRAREDDIEDNDNNVTAAVSSSSEDGDDDDNNNDSEHHQTHPPPQTSPTAVTAMPPYRSKVRVLEKYHIIGFISSGTYGRVYKAKSRQPGTPPSREFAIKKFKPDKEGEQVAYTGISQSACREMALCSELAHENIIHLHEIILEDKCIYMVFEYAEHDLLQIIHYHSQSAARQPIPPSTIKSVLWQLLNGVSYLHQNWVLHRDLKPANIMVTAAGELKIGDLGLARLFWKPLQSLYTGDKVVVTIWYRAPELLLGSKHYTAAIDTWAVGCIFAELLALRPIFKGEEAKIEKKSTVPFQRNQMQKIMEVLGTPTRERWPGVTTQPEYNQLPTFKSYPDVLDQWYTTYGDKNKLGFELLRGLLTYDPTTRLTAQQALDHPYFAEGGGKLSLNAFEGQVFEYPHRRVTQEDNDISLPGTKRSGIAAGQDERGAKRIKE